MSGGIASCAQHPDRAAAYRCDGCARPLCEECVSESHALFLCRLCGERALPLDPERAATPRERRRDEALARPYPLAAAFGYAFRGTGKYLYGATLLSMAFVGFVVRYGITCFAALFGLAFWALVVGLQFKIVRTTAEGDVELPDWPEYFSWGERLRDLALYLWVVAVQFAPLAAHLVLFGAAGLVRREPSFPFWLAAAALGWLGCGLAVFAFAAAALEGGGAALRLDRHARGLFAARGDALAVTNLTFGLGSAAFLARSALEAIPLVGAAISGALGAYWIFTGAHLVGLLARRRRALFEELYR